jgi:serine/threonine protein kinase
MEPPQAPDAPAADPPKKAGWGLSEGDEIVPGRHALKRLGGGHRYEAYLAWDDHLHAVVVIKVVRPSLVDDRHTLEGLAAEVEALARLNHPGLVRSFGADLDGDRPHVVLEHLEGPRLSSLVRKYGPLPPEQLVPLALELCSALHYVHAEHTVHLDVKPSNIIMGAPPRLIDLSVACSFEEAASLRRAVGTDAYMSPEQCDPKGRGPVDRSSDVYGLGVTLYRAASGERPFSKGGGESDRPEERWPQLVEEPQPLEGRVPAPIAEPIMACLVREPGARPSPAEVAARLEPVLESLPKMRIAKLKPRVR